MKIYFPPSAWLGTFETFLRRMDTSDPDSLVIESGESWVNVHPVFLAMVAALASDVSPENVDVKGFKTKSLDEFTRMGFFEALGINKNLTVKEKEPSGRFIPITNIANSDELSEFLKEMVPLLHLDPKHAELIRYLMSELGRNVLEHARTRTGAFFAAQYYKDNNTIRIGIADIGVGIRRAISQSHTTPNDISAIRLALTPGITGTTRDEGGTAQNAGAGLFFIKSISAANRNFMSIYSGDSMYKLLKRKPGKKLELFSDPFMDHHSKVGDLPYWPGTVVGIDITLDTTIEFTDVMELIRSTYSDAIRDRKRAKKFKQPKFI